MIVDFNSEEHQIKERIFSGWLWEFRHIREHKTDFIGITLHKTIQDMDLIAYLIGVVNYRLPKTSRIPEKYLHCYSPFSVSAKPDFYKRIIDSKYKHGAFISRNIIPSLCNYLEDYSELESKQKFSIKNSMLYPFLQSEDLYQRINFDTKDWENNFRQK